MALEVFFKGSRLFPGTTRNRSFYFPGVVFGSVTNLPPIVGFEAGFKIIRQTGLISINMIAVREGRSVFGLLLKPLIFTDSH